MAPKPGPSKRLSKGSSKGSKPTKSSSSKGPLKAKTDSRSRVSKSKSKVKLPPPKQQKSKRPAASREKKKRQYTEKELGVPQLNMITPIGVAKPRGKKKGKVFIDDAESMMTILAIVNAEKEGQIESKMVKARQMEEIREARRKEQEKRDEARKDKLEEVKDGLRKKRLRKLKIPAEVQDEEVDKKPKKKVSFG